MRVLLTGHQGYLGTVMLPVLTAAGHEVVGLDTGFFADCLLGPDVNDGPTIVRDLRNLAVEDLRGFDAVVHLAALSNDPLGNLAPQVTYAINHTASVQPRLVPSQLPWTGKCSSSSSAIPIFLA